MNIDLDDDYLDALARAEGLAAERDHYRAAVAEQRRKLSEILRVVREHLEPIRPLDRCEVEVLHAALLAAIAGDVVPERNKALAEARLRVAQVAGRDAYLSGLAAIIGKWPGDEIAAKLGEGE